MIRWYDYVVSLVVAYFMYSNLMLALFAPAILWQIYGSFITILLYDLWGGYCKIRLIMEKDDA